MRQVLRGARHPGDVAVRDGVIEAVGQVDRQPGDVDVPVSGCVVTPGLVDAHDHLVQRITRGRADGAELLDWLDRMWRVWGNLTPDDIGLAAEVALTELALAGATTVVDHHYVVPHGDTTVFDEIVAAARRVGVRLVLARGATDRPGIAPPHAVESTDACLAAMAALIERVGDDNLVTLALAPGSVLSASSELFAGTAELAATYGVRLHTHVAETESEARLCRELTGVSALELLDRNGWLSDRTWLAHGVHLTESDICLLAGREVGVVHCPSSNAGLRSGISPVAELLRAGVPVGLGVDGAASQELGVLDEGRLAVLVDRLRGSVAVDAEAALTMATAHGAVAVGRPELGRLEPGAPADLAVWDADDVDDIPDPVQALVLTPGRRVRHLFVAGRAVVRDGVPPGDLGGARRELAARGQALHARSRRTWT